MAKEREFLGKVFVTLKPIVNDPEGLTIGGALASLGFEAVRGVRSGKYFEVTLTAPTPKKAGKLLNQMCSRLLANPVIETYAYELESLDGARRRAREEST